MKSGRKSDKILINDLIFRCYSGNASVVWILMRDWLFNYRLKILSNYCFRKGLANHALFLSENEKGLAIVYHLHNEKSGLRVVLSELALVLFGIGLFRLPKIVRRDHYIRKHRSPQKALYAWIFAVDPDSRTGKEAREIRDFIFEKSDQENLPVLAETSMPQNKRVYERFGFVEYHQWEDPKTGMITWFLRRDPSTKNQK